MDVLAIVDMQNDFIEGALGTKDAVDILPNVLKIIKDFNGKTFATRDTHNEDYLQTEEGKNLPVKHCIYGTLGWELNTRIQEIIKCNPINKYTFGSIELGEAILKLHKKQGVDHIKVVGLCTDICIISNVILLKSFMPNVPISVDASCCAGTTIKNHKKALEIMKCLHINIINQN